MAKRDTRVRKLKGNESFDIRPAQERLVRAMLGTPPPIADTKEEVDRLIVEEAKMRKLVSLFSAYGIDADEGADIGTRLFYLCMAMAEEFVRGFKVDTTLARRRAAHRPIRISDDDWLELLTKIKAMQDAGKSLNAACSWASNNIPAFKRTKAKSLASQVRRLRRSLESIRPNSEIRERLLSLAAQTRKKT